MVENLLMMTFLLLQVYGAVTAVIVTTLGLLSKAHQVDRNEQTWLMRHNWLLSIITLVCAGIFGTISKVGNYESIFNLIMAVASIFVCLLAGVIGWSIISEWVLIGKWKNSLMLLGIGHLLPIAFTMIAMRAFNLS